MRTITDTNSKLSIKGGALSFAISSGHPVDPEWKFISYDDLMAMQNSGLKADKRFKEGYRITDMSALFTFTGYFLKLYTAAHVDGTFEPLYMVKDNPTVWHITYTPPNGEPRHLAIEHDDLTPAKLAELCK